MAPFKKRKKSYKQVYKDALMEGYDFFCGGGGASEGISSAEVFGKNVAVVKACINHSHIALVTHKANHPNTVHLEEDIVTCDLWKLPPFSGNKTTYFWISAECTNHSRAKGGRTKNADSRTLPEHCIRFIEYFLPDLIFFENVVEFREWGPLITKINSYTPTNDNFIPTKTNKAKKKEEGILYSPLVIEKDKETKEKYLSAHWIPDPARKGEYFRRWIKDIKKLGYDYDDKNLEAANYGAHGRRNRYFGIFAKPGIPIYFPPPTHSKTGTDDLKKWEAVREVLELEKHGISIFPSASGRKKKLSEPTLERHLKGCMKFATREKFIENFLVNYNSNRYDKDGNLQVGVGGICSTDVPSFTVASQARLSKIFVSQYNGGSPENRVKDISGPTGTIRTNNCQSVVEVEPFISKSYSGKPQHKNIPINGPAGAVTGAGGNQAIVNPQFLTTRYNENPDNRNIDLNDPAKTVTTGGHHNLVSPNYILNTDFGNNASGTDETIPTILASHHWKYLGSPDFLVGYHGNGKNYHSTGETSPCVTTKDILAKVKPIHFIDLQFTQGKRFQSADEPCQGLTTVPKCNLMEVNYDILAETEEGHLGIVFYEDDSPMTIKLKEFMCENGIVDIKMRMLTVLELQRILGFPDDYKFFGTGTQQRWMIGNAVHKNIPEAMFECYGEYFSKLKYKLAA